MAGAQVANVKCFGQHVCGYPFVVPSMLPPPGTYKLRLKGRERELVLENVTFK